MQRSTLDTLASNSITLSSFVVIYCAMSIHIEVRCSFFPFLFYMGLRDNILCQLWVWMLRVTARRAGKVYSYWRLEVDSRYCHANMENTHVYNRSCKADFFPRAWSGCAVRSVFIMR